MLLLTKAILAAFLGFIIAIGLGLIIVPILKHFHLKQTKTIYKE